MLRSAYMVSLSVRWVARGAGQPARARLRRMSNYAVPDALQLQKRIRRYNADHDMPHGDIVALALDTWLRAKGYPPDLTSPKAEAR